MALAEGVVNQDEEVVAEVPVEHRSGVGTRQLGSIIVTEDRAVFLYRADGSWVQFTEEKLSATPLARHHDGELNTVFFPEPDGDRIADLQTDYISTIEAETGTSYFTDFLEEGSREPAVDPAECDCERISSNKVLVENENLELGEYFDEQEFRFVSCKDCFTIYGRYRHGKKASLNKLFSANWLLGGDASPESIIELGDTDAYAIHYVPRGSLRHQDALLTLSHIASRPDGGVSTYKHEYQEALCYIQGDEMAGYLTWEQHDRAPILSQLYVREQYRGDGIAAALVSGWYEHVCETDHYFAEEMTTGGRAVLNSISHLGSESPVAWEVHSLDPIAFG